MFDIDQIYADGMQAWQSWQTSQLATISPDHSPVILAAHDGMVERMRAKMAGASDLIAKPIDRDIILQIAS